MGWSSWNTFGINISEKIILDTAKAMASNGLKEAGYIYVNIDDGFFNGHDENGNLRFHPTRFPNGMKPVVDGIHALGLKAGTYSDAGHNTCGSYGDRDKGGKGAGLYGYDAKDCKLHFNDLGFDFIKVDYCGARGLKLDERQRYTEISKAIKATGRKDVRFNICRWAFPGTWAADIAESWRTTGDIRANWRSVRNIIGENLYLSAYASPGHYNDMDMLEVGQLKGRTKTYFSKKHDTGLTETEELTHFGMWCMLSSPLLIGCDVRSIPESSMRLITNPYLLAVNQNDLGCQAYVARRYGGAYVLVKDADVRFGKSRYVALYNSTDKDVEIDVLASDLDLGGNIDAFDLVAMKDVGSFKDKVTVKVSAHGSKYFRFDAEKRLQRVVYEGETAYLTSYQEIRNAVRAETAFPRYQKGASGEMIVGYLGRRENNDLIWKDVKIDTAGEYILAFTHIAHDDRYFNLTIGNNKPIRVNTPTTDGQLAKIEVRCKLSKGVYPIRISNPDSWIADIDKLEIKPLSR
jgi:hypothetical protein